MTKTVEFYYDFGSPASYLAYRHLPTIAARHRAEIVYRPFLLGGVLKAAGNRSPLEIPAKEVWMWQDLRRFAKRYGVPFEPSPYLPINTLGLMRGAWAAERQGRLLDYCDAIYQAIWVDRRNLGDRETVSAVLDAAGFDPAAIYAAIEEDAIKARLKSVTEDAVRRGAFGGPIFFIGDTMIFGQDRLMFVEEELADA